MADVRIRIQSDSNAARRDINILRNEVQQLGKIFNFNLKTPIQTTYHKTASISAMTASVSAIATKIARY